MDGSDRICFEEDAGSGAPPAPPFPPSTSFETVTAGEALAVGQPCYPGGDGKFRRPDGTEDVLFKTAYIAKTAAAADGDQIEVYSAGTASGLVGLTRGAIYYAWKTGLVEKPQLGATVTSGDWIRELGHARSATSLFLDRKDPVIWV